MHKDFIPPVSIEEMAAFLDGNLTPEEMQRVATQINTNSELQDMVRFSDSIDDSMEYWQEDALTLPDELTSPNFEIPHLENFLLDDSDSFREFTPLYSKDNLIESNMATTKNYGESGLNIQDPINIQQPDDHSCALRSQQIILRDFGIDIPFKDLEKFALENTYYCEDGTPMFDIGNVLQLAGIPVHQAIGQTVYDLTNELAQGHRVIVSVDAYELWDNDTVGGKLKNWFNDVFGDQGGNHALIVAGVEVNPEDPSDVKVILTDPGSGDLRIEYPMDQFLDAWSDSNCFMVATNDPAPYQYDPNTGMEVPSNFFVEQHFNQWVAENSYQLNPDLINVPADYAPAYNGHLNTIGDMPYNEFDEKFEKLQSARSSAMDMRLDHQVESLINDLKSLFSSWFGSDDEVTTEEDPDPKPEYKYDPTSGLEVGDHPENIGHEDDDIHHSSGSFHDDGTDGMHDAGHDGLDASTEY